MTFIQINSDTFLLIGVKFKMFSLITFSFILAVRSISAAQGEQCTEGSTEQEVSLQIQNSVSSGSLVLAKAANIE